MSISPPPGVILLGNDVQDILDADSLEPILNDRFQKRVFTDEEREVIDAAKNPGQALWSIWVCKEAAYKALVAYYRDEIFAWSEYRVDPGCTRVRYGPHELAAITQPDPEGGVHAVCLGRPGEKGALPLERDLQGLYYRIDERDEFRRVHPPEAAPAHFLYRDTPDNESSQVRYQALELAGEILKSPLERLSFSSHIPPRLLRDGEPLGWPLSLSHHGRFVACAMIAGPNGE